MGNGFPIGGVICRLELADAIDDLNLFSTFGGSPPAAAAGNCNTLLSCVAAHGNRPRAGGPKRRA